MLKKLNVSNCGALRVGVTKLVSNATIETLYNGMSYRCIFLPRIRRNHRRFQIHFLSVKIREKI